MCCPDFHHSHLLHHTMAMITSAFLHRLAATVLLMFGLRIVIAAPLLPGAGPELPALAADLHELTVSGVSSGAYMAVQFQVAHSQLVRGAGIQGPVHEAAGVHPADVLRAPTPRGREAQGGDQRTGHLLPEHGILAERSRQRQGACRAEGGHFKVVERADAVHHRRQPCRRQRRNQQSPGGDAPDEMQQGTGSGVILSADGYIVTNNHVAEDASEIKVKFANDQEYKAKVIGTDPTSDVALLKIEAKDALPYLKLGDSDGLKVGDWVVATALYG